ncbi:MAG: hypothetical protein E7638_04755 [Ruminococcaceae bacterium]|nr:hypothetical protein [Oscillospiraceae bacterium]
MDRIKHNIQPMPEKPINKPSVESDTLKAFMYLADKSTHCETDEVLKAKFPNTSLRLLHMENQNLGIKISIQGKRATQLTLHGIALANEIRTNDSVRFYNKAAFVISIISLCISLCSVAVVFLA